MKTDLRIIKSRQAIENAFINLVEIKGFQNITIIEIAEKAMVNRNTIYLNYGSKEEILEAIVRTSVEKYFGNVSPEVLQSIGTNRRKIQSLYKKLFKVLDENIELYRIILTDQAASGYLLPRFKKLREVLEQHFKSNNDNKIKFNFVIDGIIGVLRNYITLATGTEEENIKVLTDLTISNLRHMRYSKRNENR